MVRHLTTGACCIIIGLVLLPHVCLAARRIGTLELKDRVRRNHALRAVNPAKRNLPTGEDALRLVGLTEQGDGLREVEEGPTVHGTVKIKLQQTFKGIDVFGDEVVVEKSGGQLTPEIEGEMVEGLQAEVPDVTPKISKPDAFGIAIKKWMSKTKDFDPSDAKYDLHDDIKLAIYDDKDTPFRLVYILSFLVDTEANLTRPLCVINALTGNVNSCFEQIEPVRMDTVGGNVKIGKHYYKVGGRFPPLEVKKEQVWCYLENENVKVYHMKSGTITPQKAFAVPCHQGATDSANGGHSPASDAFYYGNAVYDFYKKWYNDTTIPRAIGQLRMRVHYRRNYDNAIWDGKQMSFGDGYRKFYPLVSLDIVAHEVSHGVTAKTSKLVYRSQSGGMNEAFSDMAGEAAEYFLRGSNDWRIGYDVFKKGDKALRYMYNPELDGKSVGDYSKYYNGMNVHYSSGIYNKAFYILANNTGWGVRKAFGIFLRANKLYWRERSTFNNGACGVIQAAKDFGYEADEVTCAFRDVGVQCESSTPCSTGGVTTTTPAPPPTTPTKPDTCQGDLKTKSSTLYMYPARMKFLEWDVPYNACYLISKITPRYSRQPINVDMYMRKGAKPTNGTYDFKSTRPDSKDLIYIAFPEGGKWWLGFYLHGSKYSSVRWHGSYVVPSIPSPVTPPRPSECLGKENKHARSIYTRAWKYIEWPVQRGACYLITYIKQRFSIYDRNVDLYMRFGQKPTENAFDYKSTRPDLKDLIHINSPKAGTWWVGLKAARSVGGSGAFVMWYGSYFSIPLPTLPPPVTGPIPANCTGEPHKISGKLNTGTSWYYYALPLPESACYLYITIAPSTSWSTIGNADLYMRYGEKPTLTKSDFNSTRPDNKDFIYIPFPSAGTWFFGIYGKPEYRDIRWSVTYLSPVVTLPTTPPVPSTCVGIAQSPSSRFISYAVWYRFEWKVPPNACHLVSQLVPIEGRSTGNANLYMRYERKPTTLDYDYISNRWDNNEMIYISTPRSGRWQIGIYAEAGFWNVKWIGSIIMVPPTTPPPIVHPTPPPYCLGNNYARSQKYLDKYAGSGTWLYFSWQISANDRPCHLTSHLDITNRYGNADLYMRLGRKPNTQDFDYKSTRSDLQEHIYIPFPKPGRWYIGVYVVTTFSQGHWYGSYIKGEVPNLPAPDIPRIPSGCVGTRTSRAYTVYVAYWYFLHIDIPAKACHFVVRMSPTDQKANADLYLRHGDKPNEKIYDFASERPDNKDFIYVASPRKGKWIIGLSGGTYLSRAVVKITWSFTAPYSVNTKQVEDNQVKKEGDLSEGQPGSRTNIGNNGDKYPKDFDHLEKGIYNEEFDNDGLPVIAAQNSISGNEKQSIGQNLKNDEQGVPSHLESHDNAIANSHADISKHPQNRNGVSALDKNSKVGQIAPVEINDEHKSNTADNARAHLDSLLQENSDSYKMGKVKEDKKVDIFSAVYTKLKGLLQEKAWNLEVAPKARKPAHVKDNNAGAKLEAGESTTEQRKDVIVGDTAQSMNPDNPKHQKGLTGSKQNKGDSPQKEQFSKKDEKAHSIQALRNFLREKWGIH